MPKYLARAMAPLGIIAIIALSSTAAFASGGSGGGGSTSGGGGTTSSGGGSTSGGSTSGGSTSGGGGGGGGTKTNCTTTISLTASATQALTGNTFQADYVLNSCQSKTKVAVTAVDIATGYTVYNNQDLIGTTAIWSLPYALTSYQITARAYSGQTFATLASATTTVSTATPVPCTPSITETVTVGYWGIYPAIWNATNAQNCLIPGTSTHLRITNLATNTVVYDTVSPIMSWMLDYEGPAVSYSTEYQVEAELLDSSGAVMDRSVQVVTSSPLK